MLNHTFYQMDLNGYNIMIQTYFQDGRWSFVPQARSPISILTTNGWFKQLQPYNLHIIFYSPPMVGFLLGMAHILHPTLEDRSLVSTTGQSSPKRIQWLIRIFPMKHDHDYDVPMFRHEAQASRREKMCWTLPAEKRVSTSVSTSVDGKE